MEHRISEAHIETKPRMNSEAPFRDMLRRSSFLPFLKPPPAVKNGEYRKIRDKYLQRAPAISIKIVPGYWPEEWCREKMEIVSKDVQYNMEPPRQHFPDRFLLYKPNNEEYECKNDKTMGDTVEKIHIIGYLRNVRMIRRPVRPGSELQPDTRGKNTKREQVRSDTKKTRGPKTFTAPSADKHTAIETMRNDIHSHIVRHPEAK